MKKAYSYIRFSSEAQRQGDSVHRQDKLIREWLISNPDYTLDETLSFRDLGLSGYDSSNISKGGLGVFLEAVKSGLIKEGSVLLVESLDRLTRVSIDHAQELLRSLLKAGINVVTLSDGTTYDKSSLNDPLSLIKSILIAERAHEESLTKSKRVKAAWDSKRDKLRSGNDKKILTRNCPMWLEVSEDRSSFIVRESIAALIREIFKMRIEGSPIQEIARKFSKEFSPSFVNTVLYNVAVIGTLKTRAVQEPIEGYYPAIIDESTFYQVQLLKQSSKGKKPLNKYPNRVYLFKGLLVCGECHKSISVIGATETVYGAYRCRDFNSGRCSQRSISRGQVDKSLFELFRYMDRLPIATSIDNVLDSLQLKKKDCEERIQKLVEALEVSPNTKPLVERIKALQRDLDALEISIEEESYKVKSFNRDRLVDSCDMNTVEGRNEFHLIVKRLVKRIYLDTLNRRVTVELVNGKVIEGYPASKDIDKEPPINILEILERDYLNLDKISLD